MLDFIKLYTLGLCKINEDILFMLFDFSRRWLVDQGKTLKELYQQMASVGVAPTGLRNTSGHNVGFDKLPEEMSDMNIKDDKVCVSFI